MFGKLAELYERSKKGYDPVIDEWPLFSTPIPMISILITYTLLVKVIGPRFMRDRKPYDLKWAIRIYNVGQISHNLFMIFRAFAEPHYARHLLFMGCVNLEEPAYSVYRLATFRAFWHYHTNKLFDLVDTMFFVLRKKQSHITFLHVFHHFSMVSVTWTIGKYWPGQEGAMACLINLGIHVLMYTYYLLSSFGDRFSWIYKYKETLTLLQIGQFIFIFFYNTTASYVSCFEHYVVVKLVSLEALFNLGLFMNFYLRTYGKNRLTQLGARMGFCDLQLSQAMKATDENQNKPLETEHVANAATVDDAEKLKQS